MTATITFDNFDYNVIMTATDLKANVVERCCLCGVRLADDETNCCTVCVEGEEN